MENFNQKKNFLFKTVDSIRNVAVVIAKMESAKRDEKEETEETEDDDVSDVSHCYIFEQSLQTINLLIFVAVERGGVLKLMLFSLNFQLQFNYHLYVSSKRISHPIFYSLFFISKPYFSKTQNLRRTFYEGKRPFFSLSGENWIMSEND